MQTATLIDGRAAADTLLQGLAADIQALNRAGTVPGLAVIMVGDDPASAVYVRNKIAACVRHGLRSMHHPLPATTQQAAVETLIDELNADPAVHGILLQLPLPPHLDAEALIERIAPTKDVDGLHPVNLGRLMAGRPGMVPCTPQGAMRLIRGVRPDLSGLCALVIGRSLLFGKPMGQLLLQADCTVIQAHSKSRDLPALCRQADLLIVAAGRPALVKGDWIKPGATVIDVGITRGEDGTLHGDVDFAAARMAAGAITPVPGGVGPMTIACLLANTVRAARS